MDKSMIEPASLALLLLGWPLIVNLLSLVKPRNKYAFYSIAISSSAGMAAGTYAYGRVTGPIAISRWIVFSLDTPSWVFVILVYACWSMTLIYSMGYVSAHLTHKAQEFHRFMAATLGLAVGAGMADNFFTLLFFYMASIFTIVPLLALRNDDASRKATTFYLNSTIWPPLLIAIPVISFSFPLDVPFEQIHIQDLGWGHMKASGVLALIVIGLSKNCVAPFHLWLPRSAIAAAPVTAMIHSVAAVQIGSIALLKIAKHVYGFELLSDLSDSFFETGWLIYLCGGTAIYTAIQAWRTPDLKKRFSLSTVGQLSYVITAILIGTKASMQGAMLHIITHSVAKLALFFCAGAYLTAFGTVQASRVADAIPRHRWLGLAAVVSGLSIGGFPFLAGFYSKEIMLFEEMRRHQYSAAAFLLFGSLLNFAYIYPLIRATLRRATTTTTAAATVPLPMRVAIVISTAAVIALSVFTYGAMRHLEI